MSEADELALLEGSGMGAVLEEAATALAGPLEHWELRGLHHRPGAGVTGIYALRYGMPGGSVEGFLCVTTRRVAGDFPRSVRLAGPGGTVLLVWSHPHDPLLPGLGWACDPRSVGPALFGVRAAGLTTLGYRPMRRAVLRAEGAGETRYLKVLPAGGAAALRRRHDQLISAGLPAPQPVASPGADVLVTMPAAGTPLAQRFMVNGAAEVHPQVLIDLLDSFPRTVLEFPEKQPWSARVRDYSRAAVAALPEESARITRLALRVEELVRSAPAGPIVATHGDFHEGNLLVADGGITGVLDLDAVGPGHLVDDLGCFLAHLAVLPSVDERYRHVPDAVRRFQEAFEEHVDPAALRARAAGVALTLIAGARNTRGQQAGGRRAEALGRLQAAEAFLDVQRGMQPEVS